MQFEHTVQIIKVLLHSFFFFVPHFLDPFFNIWDRGGLKIILFDTVPKNKGIEQKNHLQKKIKAKY